MRTKKEISDEIAALRALVPVGVFRERTAKHIALAIEELRVSFDQTAAEFAELTDAQRDIIFQVQFWLEGDTEVRPSQGWGLLVEGGKLFKGTTR